jgi:hypothetical protein
MITEESEIKDTRSEASCPRGCKLSFHGISQDYFTKEAPQHLACEAALFCVIMMATALPLLNGANAVVKLMLSMGTAS